MPNLLLRIESPPKTIPITIGQFLREKLVEFLITEFPSHSIFLLTDSHVAKYHREQAVRHLQRHSRFVDTLVFPAGEQSKSREQKAELEDLLLQKKAGRDSLLVAMGGGVTGDLVGYVAASLHRGIPLVHLPTSLLAMIDSSIGGKVGVNHPAGKNLLGAFYQPEAIFTDIDFLQTLPETEYRNGLAEAVKYAVILDPDLFAFLEQQRDQILTRNPESLLEIITRCAKQKISVVEKDERETNYRSILNFGHTVGHAIEQLSHFEIKHGFAVAAGMAVAARLSQSLLNFPEEQVQRLLDLLRAYRLLETDFARFSPGEIWQTIQTDKKVRQQTSRFTLLDKNGAPVLFHPVSQEELFHALEAS